jgi:hypothetical protein
VYFLEFFWVWVKGDGPNEWIDEKKEPEILHLYY